MSVRVVPSVRSANEIRASIGRIRRQLEQDLTSLRDRAQENLNLRRQAERHPVLFVLAGAAVGYIVVRRPALVTRALGRLAEWVAPVLLSAFMRPLVASGHGRQATLPATGERSAVREESFPASPGRDTARGR